MRTYRIVEHYLETRSAARRSHPAVPAGTLVYAIQLTPGRYFSYSYVHYSAARRVADKLQGDANFLEDWNSKSSPSQCLVSHVTAEQVS